MIFIYNDVSFCFSFDSAWYILGQQNVAKFNEDVKNTINIHMGLIRLSEFSSDLLITFNDPINIQ
jgi:hypothetical protein